MDAKRKYLVICIVMLVLGGLISGCGPAAPKGSVNDAEFHDHLDTGPGPDKGPDPGGPNPGKGGKG